MINNKKLNPVVIELFLRDRNLDISIALITQSDFKVSKDITLNCTQFCYYENSEQKRTSTVCIKLFMRHRF